MVLYKKIRELRQSLGMSQNELAGKIGYKSRSTISKIEAGESDIPQSKIKAFADALHTTPSRLMGWDNNSKIKAVKIPVLGRVAAGLPLEAIENYDADEWEEIPAEMAETAEYFALRIQGESMEPKISEGDVVIVRKQNDIESGDIAVVIVNGKDATVKKVVKQSEGVMLIANNQAVYQPKFYSNKEIKNLPVKIVGKVVELRAKF